MLCMKKLISDGLSIQASPLDNETVEIIYLINSYSLPADFFQWLSNGTFSEQVIQEKTADGKHTRIAQYSVETTTVFTGRVEFELNKFSRETVQFLTNGKGPIASSLPEFSQLQKETVSKTCTDLHYTVISNLYHKNQCAGFCWEIFDLVPIIQLYSKMDDPLRHWRSGY